MLTVLLDWGFCMGIDKYLHFYIIVRLIPQGKIDNNLGPDRLEGSKALDPNNLHFYIIMEVTQFLEAHLLCNWINDTDSLPRITFSFFKHISVVCGSIFTVLPPRNR